MQRTVYDTPVISPIVRCIALIFLKITRWDWGGEVPDAKKYVLIAAPHTSNWDLIFTLSLTFKARKKVYWMGKDALFRFPFASFMRWLGGISVDRSLGHKAAKQVMRAFKDNDDIIIMIPPEGTRSLVDEWKRGFYIIARGAKVPIALGYLDYARREGGYGTLFYPTKDSKADMKEIRGFYADKAAKYPDKFSLDAIAPGD